jgi:hypothetical protein
VRDDGIPKQQAATCRFLSSGYRSKGVGGAWSCRVRRRNAFTVHAVIVFDIGFCLRRIFHVENEQITRKRERECLSPDHSREYSGSGPLSAHDGIPFVAQVEASPGYEGDPHRQVEVKQAHVFFTPGICTLALAAGVRIE